MAKKLYLITQQKSHFHHGLLHFLVGDEAIALGWLAGAPLARNPECCQKAVYASGVVVDQFHRAFKLRPVLNGHSAINMSGDNVVELVFLIEGKLKYRGGKCLHRQFNHQILMGNFKQFNS